MFYSLKYGQVHILNLKSIENKATMSSLIKINSYKAKSYFIFEIY